MKTFIFLLFFLVGCNPTSDQVNELVGAPTTTTINSPTTINGPLGNSALSFFPASKDFGTLAVNSGTSTQNFSVTNTSVYTVYLGSMTGNNTHFAVNSGTCSNGSVLTPLATCTFSATFAPLVAGNLGTSISIPYGQSISSNTYYSAVRLDGAGTTLVGFNGLDSISNITTSTLKLNWTGVGAADSYQIYQIVSGSAVLFGSFPSVNVCVGAVCEKTITGLNPNTTYVYRVRATDANTIQEQNLVGRTATTFAGSLELSTASGSSTSGRCINFIVTVKDSGNNPMAMTVDTPITIGGLGSGSLFSNATCTTSISGPSILTGFSSQNFYYKNPAAQNITMTASLSTYTAGSLSHNVLAGILSLSGNSSSIAGTSCTAITLTTNDASASAINMLTDASITMSGIGNGATYSDGLCSSLYPTLVVSTGTSSKIFYYKNTTAQSITLNANVSLYASSAGTLNHTIISNSADHFEYITGNNQNAYTRNNLSTSLQVKLVDQYGNGVSNQSISFLNWFAQNGFSNSTLVTTDASGVASTSVKNGSINIKDTFVVQRVGSILPDLAGSGNPHYLFNSTITTTGSGIFSAYNLTGTNPYDITSADLDLDGDFDIITAYYGAAGSGGAQIFWNNGNSTFTTTTYLTTGLPTIAVTTGFLNADNYPDVVVTHQAGTNTQGIFLNNGNGTFAAQVQYGCATNCQETVTADLDNDGDIDLAASNWTNNAVSILLNNGNGTFAAKVDYGVGTNPSYAIDTGDIDNDGDIDIVSGSGAADTMSVLKNNGNGTFAAKVDYNIGDNPFRLKIRDLNNDTYRDVVVANYNANTISVFLGNNLGTFPSRTDYPSGASPRTLDIFDYNNDGDLDLITGNATGLTVSMFSGNGDGTFNPKIDANAGTSNGAVAMTVNDFNGDGTTDAAITNFSGIHSFYILYNNGTKLNHSLNHYSTSKVNAMGTFTGDFNSDGKIDMGVTSRTSNTFSIFIAKNDYTFYSPVHYNTNADPFDGTVADLNGDNILDLVITNLGSGTGNTVSVFLGVGDGTFGAKTDFTTGTGPIKSKLADFNRDGKLDILAMNYGTNTLSLLLGNGNGTFNAKTDFTGPGNQSYEAAVGDFNNDKKLDFAVTSWAANKLSVFLGNGAGNFSPRVDYNTSSSPVGISMGDLNGDNYQDLIVANYNASTVSSFMNNGDGTFNTPSHYTTTTNPYYIATGDINGDGKLDVAVSTYNSSTVNVLTGTGTGSFNPKKDFNLKGTSPSGITLDDMNNDGKLDIITGGGGGNVITVLPNI